MMSMQTVHAVERISGVQGGYPVIAGIRTPVRTIVQMFCETYPGDIDRITEALPHLTRDQVESALNYYREYPDAVDEDIERQRRATFTHLWA